jgi:hypothetical protein
MMKKSPSEAMNITAVIFMGWVITSWLTHVIFCLMTSSWGFLVAGALLFPIACVHGTGLWFGLW